MINFYLINLVLADHLYLFPNDSYTVNPYNYFSGTNLRINSSCDNVEINQGFAISKQDSFNYSTNSEGFLNSLFPELVCFNLDEKIFIIDYQVNTIFILAFNVSTGRLSLNTSLETEYPITGIYLWARRIGSKLLVLCENQENHVFLLKPTSSGFILEEILIWDLRYLKNLKSCEVDNSSYVPFTGNYDSELSLVLLFQVDEDLTPIFIMSFYEQGNIIDVAFQDFRNGTLEVYSLMQNQGVKKTVFNYLKFSVDVSFVKLNFEQITIQLVWNSFYDSILDSKVLSVGGMNGSYYIQSNTLNIMFFLESGSDLFMTSAVSFENLLLAVREDRSLMIFNDSVSDQLMVIQNDFSSYIDSFFTSKWYFFQMNFNDILMIISNQKGLLTFVLNFELVSAVIEMTDRNASCDIFSDKNETANFELTLIEDKDLIYFMYLDRISTKDVIFLEILFDGFKKEFFVDPYSVVSGRNMSFELNASNFNTEIFTLFNYSFDKLSLLLESQISFNIEYALVNDESIFLVSKNTKNEYKLENNTLVFVNSFMLDEIFSVASGSSGLFTSFQFKNKFYISLENPFEIFFWEIDFLCQFLDSVNSYVVCHNLSSITIFNLTQSKKFTSLRTIALNSSIIDMCVFNETINAHILLIDSNFTIILISINFAESINGSVLFTLENSYRVIANYPDFFLFTPSAVQVYKFPDLHTKTIDLPEGKFKIFSLNNFLYLYSNSRLLILDGLRNKLNIYFLDIQLESSWKVVGTGFYLSKPWLFITCFEKNSTLKIFTSSCPIMGNFYPCNFLLPMQVNITNYKEMTLGEYSQNFSINAKNEKSLKSFEVVLKLIVYGQAVQMVKGTDLKLFEKMNYDQLVTGNLMQIFTGNNLRFDLVVRNSNKDIIDNGSPLKLTDRIIVTSRLWDSLMTIYSLTSIPYKNLLIFSNNCSILSVFNTSSNNVSSLDFSKVKNIQGLTCPSVKFLFFFEPFVYLAVVCRSISEDVKIYMNGKMRLIHPELKFYLMLMRFNIHTIQVDQNMRIVDLDSQPYVLNIAYEKSSSVYIMLISQIQNIPINEYLNNEVRVIKMTVKSDFFIENDYHINFRTLKINKFYATSVDGIFVKFMLLAVVDRYLGLRLLKITNNEISEYHQILYQPNEPFISVTFTFKVLNLFTLNGKTLYYKFSQNLTFTYYVTRYPYTVHNVSIFTVPSRVSYDTFYFNRYLVFPVTYDYTVYYFRFIDNEVLFSSSIIKDINFTRPDTKTFNFHVEFVDSHTAYFINSTDEICMIKLEKPKVSKPPMTKSDFKKLKDQGQNEFEFELVASNQNNNCSTGFIRSEILGYESSRDDKTSFNVWMIPLISIILVIALTVSSVILYRCFFKRKNLIHDTEVLEEKEIVELLSMKTRIYDDI